MSAIPMARRLALGVLLISILAPSAVQAQPTELPGLQTDALVVYDSNGIPHVCTGTDRDTFFMQGYVHARDRFFQMDTLRRTFSGTVAELVGPAALGSDVQFRTLGLRRAAAASLNGYAAAGLGELLEMFQAYSQGVNAYLASHPLPPEYGPLELTQASPWTPLDSAVVGKGLAFGLSFDLLDLELTIQAAAYGAAGAAQGFDGLALLFEDVSRSAPFDPTVSIPPPSSQTAADAKVQSEIAVPKRRTAELARRYRDKVAAIPLLKKTLDRRQSDRGSNWWLVAGDRSASGHAMLANDPHLGLDTPSTFYEVHLISSDEAGCGLTAAAVGGETDATAFRPAAGGGDRRVENSDKQGTGLNVNGVSFAGTPGVILGCNDHICWGATVNPMDVTDVYQEVVVIDPLTGLPTGTLFDGQPEPLLFIPQSYRFNQPGDGVPDNLADAAVGPLEGGVIAIVPRRNHGPILQFDASQLPVIALSVQYTGWGPTFEFETFRRWQKASNLDQFVAGLQYFDVGSQNFAYADVAGNIAYFTSAEMPIREDLQTLGFPDGGIPPFLIRDGTHTLRHEWLAVQNPQPQQALPFEILPFAEMPKWVNPDRGYIVNANNDPIGTTLDNNPLNQVRPGGGIFYLNPGYAELRVGRIDRLMQALLAGDNRATADDLKAIQANNQLLDAELVAPFLTAAFANASDPGAAANLQELAADPGIAEAVTRLMAWDFSTPTGIPQGYDPGDDPLNLPQPSAEEIANSVAATIWSAFRGQLTRFVVDETMIGLGLGDFLPGSTLAYKAVAHLLMTYDQGQGVGASGVDFFHGPAGMTPAEERDYVLLAMLGRALDLLASDEFAPAFGNSTDQDDYRWGYLHRIVFDHLLGGPFSVPPAAGFQHLGDGLPGVARSGGFGAVDASSHSARADGLQSFMFGSGPARRFVGVLDPAGIEADEIIPGGESGVVVSPHYASQLGRWLTNDYHPLLLTPAAVQADAVAQQEFTPSCAPSPTTLCLQDRRFKVQAVWEAPMLGVGPGRVVPGFSNLSGN
ncbi:MAG: penicillin acylase family protein, partial [Thermoanaerobaculia bacterium]